MLSYYVKHPNFSHIVDNEINSVQIKGLHPCLRDLANTRIREPDSQEMAGSYLAREKIRFSGLVCSRPAFLI